uniref:Nucleotide-diphospho-sugar transferase domain-containing protein n=1 Tax=Entomoneis paludosa TaxID=265537 RepID=A0A7S2YMC4_9STRA
MIFNDTAQTNVAPPISLLNSRLSEPTPHNKSVILTFVTKGFVSHIPFWYESLSALGYTEHAVAAWDEETMEYCKKHEYRTIPCITHGYKGDIPNNKSQLFRRYLFAARWKCVHEQLHNGHNVLLTDVDNTFQRFVPLSNFESFNVIHAYGGGYPIRHLKSHGFTVCGGMTWLQAHPATIRYVDLIIDRCRDRCDDQGVVNSLFDSLGVEWRAIEALEQAPLPESHNWPEPAGSRHGIANLTGHSVKVWDTGFAFRGPLAVSPCPDDPWVAMPANEKTGEKTHYRWEEHCPRKKNTTAALKP